MKKFKNTRTINIIFITIMAFFVIGILAFTGTLGYEKDDKNKTNTNITQESSKKDNAEIKSVKISEEEATEEVKKISSDNNLLLLRKDIVTDKDISGTSELVGKYCYFFGYKGGSHTFYSYIVNSETGDIYECDYQDGDAPTITPAKQKTDENNNSNVSSITEEQAVAIMQKIIPNGNFQYDNTASKDGVEYYVIRQVGKGAGTTLTVGWFYVSKKDGFAFKYNLADSTLAEIQENDNVNNKEQSQNANNDANNTQQANKASITSNSSGINYTIQSITYSQAANVSKIDIKCSNPGNKAFVVMLTVTFYNSNNEVIGKADSGVNLEPDQWAMMTPTPMCAGNVKNFDHFSVTEGLMDNTEFYKAKQEINEKYGFH